MQAYTTHDLYCMLANAYVHTCKFLLVLWILYNDLLTNSPFEKILFSTHVENDMLKHDTFKDYRPENLY